MWSDVTFGLMVVSMACLCVSQGYLFTSMARGVKIQAELLKAQADLAAIYAEMRATGGVAGVPVSGWRQLPPEGRAQLRTALATVLAEMDADGAVRH